METYDSNKEVRLYFDYLLNPNEEEQYEKCKQIITNEYFPKRGEPKTRLAVCKKAISDFAKLNPAPELLADAMIYLIVCGCKFIYEYGDMTEPFYNSMENNYEKALNFAAKNGLLEKISSEN